MINRVELIGNTGKDPDIRYSNNGNAIANFNLATSRSYKKGEEWQKDTEWHKIVSFGDLAERIAEKVKKGMLLYLTGRLQTRDWEDKDGNKRWTTEIIIDSMKMLGSKNDSPRESSGNPFDKGTSDIPDDDVPF